MIKGIAIEAMITRGFSNDEIADILLGMFIMKNDGNGGDIDEFLRDNGIVQIYNKRVGIKTVSNEPSEKFWFALQGMDDEIYFFTKDIISENNFDIIDKIIDEFNIQNVDDIETVDTNSRTNEITLKYKDGTMKISELYGGIEYKNKLYYYNLSDCIIGDMGKAEDGTQYIKIGGIKYSLMFDSK